MITILPIMHQLIRRAVGSRGQRRRICVYAYMYMYLSLSLSLYIYIYICIYIYIYTYIITYIVYDC